MKDIFIVYEMPDGSVHRFQQAAEDRRIKGGAYALDADGNIDSLAGKNIPRRMTAEQVTQGIALGIVESDEEATARYAQMAWPRDPETGRALAKRYVIVGPDAFPKSETFRNAWRLVDGKVAVDLEAAKAQFAKMAALLARKALERLASDAAVAGLLDDAEKSAAVKDTAQRVRALGALDVSGVRTVAELETVWAQTRAEIEDQKP